jgi:uncharacterized damage-inducible protein DinB
MSTHDEWRSIIASALDWEQAHAKFDSAVEGLAPELRGKLPDNFPHSVWMLVDHIRRTQADLLDFCQNANYEETLKWPDDYWPAAPAPASEAEWNASIAQVRRDTQALKEFTETFDQDLSAKIPHGTGQTYLRTILVAIDHTSYHVGQILAVRRLIGAWTKS